MQEEKAKLQKEILDLNNKVEKLSAELESVKLAVTAVYFWYASASRDGRIMQGNEHPYFSRLCSSLEITQS